MHGTSTSGAGVFWITANFSSSDPNFTVRQISLESADQRIGATVRAELQYAPTQNSGQRYKEPFPQNTGRQTSANIYLISVQQDANYSVYYNSVGSSTCFGC